MAAHQLEWPGDEPERYAVMYEDRVEIISFGNVTALGIADVRAGSLAGDEFVFALEGYFGTWAWPPRPDLEGVGPTGGERTSMLLGQAATEIHTWFRSVTVINDRPTVVYSEIETEVEHAPERVKLYDLETGHTSQLFDKADRRRGLHEEEQQAWIITASGGEDRFAFLLGFGDSTWLEWYGSDGRPIDDPFDQSVFAGDVAEAVLSPAGDLMAVALETEHHQPIQDLQVVDLDGVVLGRWTVNTPGGSIHGIDTDGRQVTAGIVDERGIRVGVLIIDLASGESSEQPIPVRIALDTTGPPS